ncbi:MAG: TRAP transporter small permease [Lautropia sp.]
MSGVLDGFFRLTTAAAAVLFVAIAALVLYQLGGQVLPYVPRSADEFAGYCMGASAFLALADTLRAGEHIRVTLLTDRLPAVARRGAAWAALLVSIGLSAWMAWYFVRQAWVSWTFGEASSGLIALPMWLPQGAMAWGAVAFVVALLETAVRVARGGSLPGGPDAPPHPDGLG